MVGKINVPTENDIETSFLGLIGDDSIIEIKCLFKCHRLNLSLESAVIQDKNLCVKQLPSNNFMLKRNHNYYYQVHKLSKTQ